MSTGIAVNEECLAAYQSLKLGKKCKYVIFVVNDRKTEIIVSKTSESDKYEDFLAELPEDDCRYAVYDFEYEKPGGGKRNKLCFVAWSPDSAKIKSKMVYAASKEALRQTLVGVATEIQGTAYDEISYDAVLDKVGRGA